MGLGIIYLAVNRVNQKAYVGQTKIKFHARINNHLSTAATKNDTVLFHQAIRKYGFGAFDFAVLEETLTFALDDREEFWIKHLGSKSPNGYNCTDGGQGATGCEYTPERREKVRQSQLGDRNRMKNPETARKHGESIRGENHQFFGRFGADHPSFGQHYTNSEQGRLHKEQAANTLEGREYRSKKAQAAPRDERGVFIRRNT